MARVVFGYADSGGHLYLYDQNNTSESQRGSSRIGGGPLSHVFIPTFVGVP